MAGREKKPALVKKQMLSPVPPKEGDSTTETAVTKSNIVKTDAEATDQTASVSTIKKIRKPNQKKTIKKNLKINFRTKAKANKKLKLSKSLFKASKLALESKNVTLLKNGIKNKRKPKLTAVSVTNDIKTSTATPTTTTNTTTTTPTTTPTPATTAMVEDDLLPPVLEPAIPIPDQNIANKKDPKKRTKKSALDDAAWVEANDKKLKLEKSHDETVEDILNEVANELDIDLEDLMKQRKKAALKKTKIETIVKSEDAKPTAKRSPKKLKPETSKLKKPIKKENLIDSLGDVTIDSAAENVINNLDLNVTKTTARKKTIKKRRHSIEKIPAVEETATDSSFEQPFLLFPNTRRSASPKTTKRTAKIRKSIDNATAKRLNPYTTRSDSPARILRNGKHRKLKDSQLLEGLSSVCKKRRRLCSEYSGSEVSKCSGYLSESDSSFSDLASLQENGANDMDSPPKDECLTKSDLLKKEILDSIKGQTPTTPTEVTDLQNLNIKQISNKFTAILKRSLSTDTNQLTEPLLNEDVKPKLDEIPVNSFTDTNSNDVKLQVKTESGTDAEENVKTETVKCDNVTVKEEKSDDVDEQKIAEKIASSPSEKVPEKSLILDSMKLTFNDVAEDLEKRSTRSTKRQLKLLEERDKIEAILPGKFYGTDAGSTASVAETPVENNSVDEKEPENTDDPVSPSPVTDDTGETKFEKQTSLDEDLEKQRQEMQVEEFDLMDTKSANGSPTNEQMMNDKEVINDEENASNNTTPTDDVNMLENLSELEEDNNLLEKLKENSAISIMKKDKAIEEQPVLPETTEENSENKENTETINNLNGNKEPTEPVPVIEETPENQVIKENILSALGLQSLRAAEEAKKRDKQKIQTKPETYTGTLKTVIKLNRQPEKKKRNPLKMTLQKSKSRSLKDGDGNKSDGANSKSDGEGSCYKVMKESGSSSGWRHGSHSSDTAGANRKSHYSNRSNMDGSSEHASDGDVPLQDGETSGTKALVIPEKASSFGIHPDRLCSDECAYCFGKFGLFDTPLHIAQIKSEERQNKILQTMLADEIYLTRDSCLCDACYRHVDRRINSNSSTTTLHNKNLKRNTVLPSLPRQNTCHVLGCDQESSHVLRRKWLMKMRKSVLKVINIDLDNPGLHSIPICSKHYQAVEHLMVCALCKRRLARNHIHYLGFELDTLNAGLEKEGIPVKLTDKPVVCKLCRYFATLLLKDSNEIKSNTANFFKQYKKRLLHFHDIEVMDEAEAEEPIAVPMKEKTTKEDPKKKNSKANRSSQSRSSRGGSGGGNTDQKHHNNNNNNSNDSQPQHQHQHDSDKPDQSLSSSSRVPSNSENGGESRESSPANSVDIETLVPNMILECASDTDDNNSNNNSNSSSNNNNNNSSSNHHHHQHQQNNINNNNRCEIPISKSAVLMKKLQIPESVREAVEISKIMKFNRTNATTITANHGNNKRNNVVERLGANPSISVRQLFPGEEELPLQGNIDFNSVKERTPEGWEKTTCTIQYDIDTKHLWQELQKPYGNQSSFLRHLILLEKYFRNGDLTLSPNASHHAVNYSVSVQNRLRAYDNIPTNALPMQPLTMLPFNQVVKKSQSGIITTNKDHHQHQPSQQQSQHQQHQQPQSSASSSAQQPPLHHLANIVNAANLPKNTPIPIASLNPNFLTQLSIRQQKSAPGVPPGLISLQPGTNRPVAPVVKMPQKFKLPLGTKWRPTLIPINPKGAPINSGEKRLTGLVQVISGGKPYHISIADYNRMCYLKKTHEMKLKAAETKLKQREPDVSSNSVLKPVVPRKQKSLIAAAAAAANNSPAAIALANNKAVTMIAVSKDLSTAITTATPSTITTATATIDKVTPSTSTVTSGTASVINEIKNGNSNNISLTSETTLNVTKSTSSPATATATISTNNQKSLMILPKIPKSLTVIPQTVPRKPLQASSPTLSITTKSSANNNNNNSSSSSNNNNNNTTNSNSISGNSTTTTNSNSKS